MYQIITQTWINDERIPDKVEYKIYKNRSFAERKAKEIEIDYMTSRDHHIVRKSYVRKTLTPVTEEKAKEMYCIGYNVYVDGEYGKKLVTPAGWYGSHATATELFYRGVNNCRGYYKQYDGNYYIEDED